MPTIPLRLVAIDDRHHQWDQQYEPCRDGRASDAPVLQRAFEAYPHDRPRCFKYPERDRIACNRGRELLPSVCGLRKEMRQIGRASCRESVCKCVSVSVVAVTLKKK